MSLFNLGGSRGGLVRWVWGVGISVGALKTLRDRQALLKRAPGPLLAGRAIGR
jgi:hypothetical protein